MRGSAARATLIGLLLGVHACASQAALSVTDDAGQRITVEAPVRRIVSLAPHATEMIYAAGAGAALVGTIARSDWPPPARKLPRVGDAGGLDLERILALQPELVVTWPYTAAAQVDVLRRRGIRVFVIDARSVEDIARGIERLGVLTGHTDTAHAAAQEQRRREAALRERYAVRATLGVFYEVWPAPLVTLGGGHIVSRAIETCGGRNVFAGEATPAPTVTVEAVLAAKPDVIIAGADDGRRPDWLAQWQRWTDLPAVAMRNLYTVDADLLHRPGPRFVDGIAELCKVIDTARLHGAPSR